MNRLLSNKYEISGKESIWDIIREFVKGISIFFGLIIGWGIIVWLMAISDFLAGIAAIFVFVLLALMFREGTKDLT